LAVRISIVEDVAKWKGGYDLDAMHLEVVSLLPRHDEDHVQEFLDLWVEHLGVAEYFTDEVSGSLHLVVVPWFVSFDV
jgi:hypothetical protein